MSETKVSFGELMEFVDKRMKMSHIYQPLLIKSLLNSNGAATLRHLACDFVAEDESQLLYYEDRINKMPVKVLKSHGIIEQDGELIRLQTGKLSFQQKAQLKALCDQKINEFLEKRGLATWDYSLLETDPVPDTIRYAVLTRAHGKCEACGIAAKERPLHVDHIKPRSTGGKNDLDNLQALCSKCNLGKGNRDATDFRGRDGSTALEANSPFHPIEKSRMLTETDNALAFLDAYPLSKGHALVIPKQTAKSIYELHPAIQSELWRVVSAVRNILTAKYKPHGFNIGINDGPAAGQTIAHAHIHIIPRYKGDTPDPRGGLRWILPDKAKYWRDQPRDEAETIDDRHLTIDQR